MLVSPRNYAKTFVNDHSRHQRLSHPERDSGTKEKTRVHLRCFETYPGIFSMSSDATGITFFKTASGLMMRPSLSFFALMYTQMAFVTSVRGSVFLPPQIAESSADRVFGAKIPLPAFFMASAFFAPEAFCNLLLWAPFTRLPLESFVIFLTFVTVLRMAFFTTFFAPLRAARLAAPM